MATPTLSPDFTNGPSNGPAVVIDPTTFNRETEKNVIPLTPTRSYTGYTTQDTFRLPNRGIMTHLRLVLELTVTTAKGNGTITKRQRFQHGIIKNLVVRANGTIVHNVDGLDLKTRRQIVAKGAADPITSDTVNGAVDAAYTNTVVWDVPLCVDNYSLIGALFAESDANYFDVQITYASQAELFDLTGTAAVTITGTLKPLLTTFDVVRIRGANGAPTICIPDLSHVFMMQGVDQGIPANGRQVANISKVDGQLLRAMFRMQNGTAAGQDGYDLTTATSIEWLYGVNQKPQVWTPAKALTYKNINDYQLQAALPNSYGVIDFIAENGERDSVDPHGVADPQIAIDFGSTTVNTAANLHICQETLVRAAGFEAVPVYQG